MKNNQKELILLQDLGMQYPSITSKQKKRYGLYKCFCGNEFKTQIASINDNKTKSCGCHKINVLSSHNLSKHRLYKTWQSMMDRCFNKKCKDYKNYGARDITVCKRWHSVENFINDMYPSYIEGLTLDRIDTNGNYEKDNCRWATKTVQSRNSRLLKSTNTSGYRGVSIISINRFKTRIVINKKILTIGYFDDKIEAARAYDKYIIDNNLQHTRNFS